MIGTTGRRKIRATAEFGTTEKMIIRTSLLDDEGQVHEGDLALLEKWDRNRQGRLWLDIEGEISDQLREKLIALGCHEVAIRDVRRDRQPPKVHGFEDNTFILFRGIIQLDEYLNLTPQQIGFFVGNNYLVTVHRGTSLSINRAWSESTQGAALASPAGLAIKIMYYAAGRYLDRILEFEAHLGELEDSLLAHPSDRVMTELVVYRSELRKLRRIFNYHKRLVEEILSGTYPHLGTGADEQHHLWRSLLDRCERLYSLTSMYYEICGDLVEGYISISSHELNVTMKILTIITAIFVPLSFLAGLYGMNFDHMPELHMRYGYFFALSAMVSIAALLVYIFKRKKWL